MLPPPPNPTVWILKDLPLPLSANVRMCPLKETGPLICWFLYDRDLSHGRVKHKTLHVQDIFLDICQIMQLSY